MQPFKTILILSSLLFCALGLSAQYYMTHKLCDDVTAENFEHCKDDVLSFYDARFSHLEFSREELEAKLIHVMRNYLDYEGNGFCPAYNPSTLSVIDDDCANSTVLVTWPGIRNFKTLKAATISFDEGQLNYKEEFIETYLLTNTPGCVKEKLFITNVECQHGVSAVDVIIIADKDIRSNDGDPSSLDPILLREVATLPTTTNADFYVAPNPLINNRTNIFYNGAHENATVRIHTYNAQGQLINSKIENQIEQEENYSTELNFEGIAPGIYFIVLESSSDRQVQRIIKQ